MADKKVAAPKEQKKVVAKKPAAKKPVAKKPVAKKAVAKKVEVKKPVLSEDEVAFEKLANDVKFKTSIRAAGKGKAFELFKAGIARGKAIAKKELGKK